MMAVTRWVIEDPPAHVWVFVQFIDNTLFLGTSRFIVGSLVDFLQLFYLVVKPKKIRQFPVQKGHSGRCQSRRSLFPPALVTVAWLVIKPGTIFRYL